MKNKRKYPYGRFNFKTGKMDKRTIHPIKKPTGKNQKSMHSFLKRNNGWQSYSKDSVTKKTVSSFEKKGLICVSKKTNQMKLKVGSKCKK